MYKRLSRSGWPASSAPGDASQIAESLTFRFITLPRSESAASALECSDASGDFGGRGLDSGAFEAKGFPFWRPGFAKVFDVDLFCREG